MSRLNVAQPKAAPLTIGVLADLPSGLGGGVNHFTRGLVHSLALTIAPDMRLVVFVLEGDTSWNLPPNERVAIVNVDRFQFPQGWKRWAERVQRYGGAALEAVRNDRLAAGVTARFGERTRRILRGVARSPWPLDIMHFPFQSAAPMRVPTLFGLWDLQHLHLPELRPVKNAAELDRYYRWCCRLADCVTFGSEWARQDAVERYRLPVLRTAVVPVASPLRMLPQPTFTFLAEVRRRHALPSRFAFYPAVGWAHKNHLGLISALARLHGPSVDDLHLVCSGHKARHVDQLIAHAEQLGVRERIHFLGYVTAAEVKALYRLAEFCIYPTLFEGAGLPVLEAFDERCPVAASAVTSIPEYAGDAALVFDPRDVDAIAAAMGRLGSDEHLRLRLVRRGIERARRFSWERVVADYMALYRELACNRHAPPRHLDVGTHIACARQ